MRLYGLCKELGACAPTCGLCALIPDNHPDQLALNLTKEKQHNEHLRKLRTRLSQRIARLP